MGTFRKILAQVMNFNLIWQYLKNYMYQLLLEIDT